VLPFPLIDSVEKTDSFKLRSFIYLFMSSYSAESPENRRYAKDFFIYPLRLKSQEKSLFSEKKIDIFGKGSSKEYPGQSFNVGV